MELPDVDVTHVARAAAEIARGLVAGDDVAAEVQPAPAALVPRHRASLTGPEADADRKPAADRGGRRRLRACRSPTVCCSVPDRRTRTPRSSPRSDARCSGTWTPSSSRSWTRRWRGCAPSSAPTNALTFPVSGTGSAGMEACFVNLLEAGDTVIVGANGVFGDRMCEVARRCGADVVRVEEEWGRRSIRSACSTRTASTPTPASSPSCTRRRRPASRTTSRRSPRCATPTRCCSSTRSRRSAASRSRSTSGASTPATRARRSASACRPGSRRSRSRRGRSSGCRPARCRRSRGTSTCRSSRTTSTAPAACYHHTAPVSMVFALHAALGALLDEGLEAAWARHRAVGTRLQDALPELGFRLVVPEGHRLPELTTAWLPDGADDATLRKELLGDLRHRGRRRARAVRRQGVAHRPHGPLGARAVGHDPPRRAARAARLSRAVRLGTVRRRPVAACARGSSAARRSTRGRRRARGASRPCAGASGTPRGTSAGTAP